MFQLNSVPKPTYKRRTPKRANKGKFSKAVRKAIIERDNGLCVRCGRPYEDIHHIQFRSQGGEGTIDNGACVCRSCHEWAHRTKKGREWFEQWKLQNK